MLEKEDILKVANDLKVTDLTDTEIAQIIEEHEAYQRADPSGSWDLVVEQQIDDIVSNR
jgi:hypothetical protein